MWSRVDPFTHTPSPRESQAPQDPRALREVPDTGPGAYEGSESYLVTVDTPTAPVQRLGELRPPAFARAAGIRTRCSRTSGPLGRTITGTHRRERFGHP